MVATAQDYIAAGDIYQVCLSHPFEAFGETDSWTFYEMLRKHSPAPHGAYLSFGDMRIASASPEVFYEFQTEKYRLGRSKEHVRAILIRREIF
jgi:anthranilate/para-aminobenzoate synthase component I